MTEYIKREPVTVERITCSHPQVTKIWEYGGASMNPTDGTMKILVAIQLKSGEVVNFDETDSTNPYEKTEKYLSELPIK